MFCFACATSAFSPLDLVDALCVQDPTCEPCILLIIYSFHSYCSFGLPHHTRSFYNHAIQDTLAHSYPFSVYHANAISNQHLHPLTHTTSRFIISLLSLIFKRVVAPKYLYNRISLSFELFLLPPATKVFAGHLSLVISYLL